MWYANLNVEDLIPTIQDEEARKRFEKWLTKAWKRSVLEHDFPEIATTAGLAPAIKDNPPLIYHLQEVGNEEMWANIKTAFNDYRETLQEDRRLLLDRFGV